jgi:hypothetical protein
MRGVSLLLVAAGIVIGIAGSASSALVSYEFTASNQVDASIIGTGSFSYDEAMSPFDSTDPNIRVYAPNSNGHTGEAEISIQFTSSLGTVDSSLSNSVSVITNPMPPVGHTLQINVALPGLPGDASVILRDTTSQVFATTGTDLPTSLNLSSFDFRQFSYYDGSISGFRNFTITSLSPIPVPEPSTYAMALAGLACGGYSLFRRRKRA